MAIYTAPSWRGPYIFRSLTRKLHPFACDLWVDSDRLLVFPAVYGEDPYVWHDPHRDAVRTTPFPGSFSDSACAFHYRLTALLSQLPFLSQFS